LLGLGQGFLDRRLFVDRRHGWGGLTAAASATSGPAGAATRPIVGAAFLRP
jgi:hypothetical protein